VIGVGAEFSDLVVLLPEEALWSYLAVEGLQGPVSLLVSRHGPKAAAAIAHLHRQVRTFLAEYGLGVALAKLGAELEDLPELAEAVVSPSGGATGDPAPRCVCGDDSSRSVSGDFCLRCGSSMSDPAEGQSWKQVSRPRLGKCPDCSRGHFRCATCASRKLDAQEFPCWQVRPGGARFPLSVPRHDEETVKNYWSERAADMGLTPDRLKVARRDAYDHGARVIADLYQAGAHRATIAAALDLLNQRVSERLARVRVLDQVEVARSSRVPRGTDASSEYPSANSIHARMSPAERLAFDRWLNECDRWLWALNRWFESL
jgi:hypothetical protein